MIRDFYARIGGVEFSVRVMTGPVGGQEALQVSHRRTRISWTSAKVTPVRYLKSPERERVFAGLRHDERMPAWMLADVLAELRIPDHMCEVVRQSELAYLGDEWRKGREDW